MHGQKGSRRKNERVTILVDPNRKKKLPKELGDYLKTTEAEKEFSAFDKEQLPFIRSEEEYHERFRVYELEKEKRNMMYFHKTRESYLMARRMYYLAIAQIYFLIEGFERVKEVCDWYDMEKHTVNMSKIIICLRKIAYCCYKIGNYIEGYDICCSFLKIVEEHNLNPKWNYLLYGVMASILSENSALIPLALSFVDEGLSLKESPKLREVREKIQEKADLLMEEKKQILEQERRDLRNHLDYLRDKKEVDADEHLKIVFENYMGERKEVRLLRLLF